ncbi:MAG TPA: response regulator [Candidatus Hypogeohydataceae bacterium YC41]
MMAVYQPTQGKYSLLITDEDEGYRRHLQETFEPKGYNTYLAGSGREAIEIAREVLIHALIMDMDLPDISGLEAFRYIKHEVKLILPCILLSCDTTKELMLRALSANAYTVISKPVNLEVILFAVEQLIKKYYLGKVGLPPYSSGGESMSNRSHSLGSRRS